MIFKSDLVEAINDLNHDLTLLSVKINDINKDLDAMELRLANLENMELRLESLEDFMNILSHSNYEPVACEKPAKQAEHLKKTIKVKKAPGRPKKVCVLTDKTKAIKSSNAKKQPRNKDGKFAKKK